MLDTRLRIPPFNLRVRSPHRAVVDHLRFFYRDFPPIGSESFVDFDVQILAGRGPHRFWRPQARFGLDELDPFLPLPADQAAPLFEWGLNWAIASRPLGYLVMHAAVVARDDAALVLPGFPGAGKSTLCASLVWLAGWRLLSDELAVLDPSNDLLSPNPRPISLKNASIEIVERFGSVRMGPAYADTRKGTISHAAVPEESIVQSESPARCRWVVFPRFRAGCKPWIDEIPKAEAFALISQQSFNKERMGETGFAALCRMLDRARCFAMDYGSTTDGLRLIDGIGKE